MSETSTPDLTVNTCELDEDACESKNVRVFVSDWYEETEELEMRITRNGIDFMFFFEGEDVGRMYLSHEDLFRLLIEKKAELLEGR